MVDPVTTNRGLAVPTHGSDVDTWDQPLNNNFGALDTFTGGVTGISSSGGTVVLNAAQLNCGTITVSGALTSNVTLVFPAIQGWFSIENLTSGNFSLNAVTTIGAEQIGLPPGEITDIQVNGAAVRFRNLGRVGSYLDYAGDSVPLWVANCNIKPYFNCDGSSFSGGTYPRLAAILGGTTLPDCRGSISATLNQGTARIPASSGVNGDARFAIGGNSLSVLGTGNLPPYTPSGSLSGSVTTASFYGGGTSINVVVGTGGGNLATVSNPVSIGSVGAPVQQTMGLTGNIVGNAQGGASTAFTNMPPTTITGIRMIRAG